MNLRRHIREAKRIRRLTPEELAEHKLRRLHRLVAYAKEHAPFFNRLYRKIDPDTCTITDLPTTNKDTLMDKFDDAVTDSRLRSSAVIAWCDAPVVPAGKFEGEFALVRSSGTSGRNGYFAYSRNELKRVRAHQMVAPSRQVIAFKDTRFSLLPWKKMRLVTLSTPRGVAARVITATKFGPIARYLTERRTVEITDPTETIVQRLNAYDPHHLGGYPSVVEMLAEQQRAQRLKLNLLGIDVFGEVCSERSQTFIEETFGCKARNIYGAAENHVIAQQCINRRLHVLSDLLILEPVDRDGRPTEPGTPSDKVLLTCLGRYAQPIIRYELEDSIVVHDDSCACGFPTRTIEIIGRAQETFMIPGPSGELVPLRPQVVLIQVIRTAGVNRFQIRQDAPDLIRVLFIPKSRDQAPSVGRNIERNIEELLTKHGLHGCVKVEIDLVEDIARTASGKYQKIVNFAHPKT